MKTLYDDCTGAILGRLEDELSMNIYQIMDMWGLEMDEDMYSPTRGQLRTKAGTLLNAWWENLTLGEYPENYYPAAPDYTKI